MPDGCDSNVPITGLEKEGTTALTAIAKAGTRRPQSFFSNLLDDLPPNLLSTLHEVTGGRPPKTRLRKSRFSLGGALPAARKARQIDLGNEAF